MIGAVVGHSAEADPLPPDCRYGSGSPRVLRHHQRVEEWRSDARADQDLIESAPARARLRGQHVALIALGVLAAAGAAVAVWLSGVLERSPPVRADLALRGGDYGATGLPAGRVELAVALWNTGRTPATVKDFRLAGQGLRLVSVDSNWPATASDPHAYRITPAGAARLTLTITVSCSGPVHGGSLALAMTRDHAGVKPVSLPLPKTLPSPTGNGQAAPLGQVLRVTACAGSRHR